MPPTPASVRQLGAALRALLALTVLLGLAYPLVMTGLAQVAFPGRADGSLVERRGTVVGSELIGQSFTRPRGEAAPGTDGVLLVPDPAYFQSRPSAAGEGYDPLATGASNYGPESHELLEQIRQRRASAARLDGVDPERVPPDALLASGSGLDPHISPEYAAEQVARVAEVRGVPADRVRQLVADHTSGRQLGFLGQPHVNVLMLNLALDELAGVPGATASIRSPGTG